MKKLFIVFIVFFLFISIIVSTAFAQSANDKLQENKVQYNLAYPGILPDHPLYKLKVLRDKLTILLINDPKKRVEYYLLQADKGIHAAAMLVDKNKIELAKETLLKGENNVTLLTFEFGKFQRKPNSDFFNKLETASLKHQEIIALLQERVQKDEQKSFKQVFNFSKTNLDTIRKFQSKKFFRVE